MNSNGFIVWIPAMKIQMEEIKTNLIIPVDSSSNKIIEQEFV